MTSCHISGLSGEIHFHIENNVALHKGVVRGQVLVVIEDIEGNAHVLHFLLDGVLPKGVAVVFIHLQCFVDSGRDGDPELV